MHTTDMEEMAKGSKNNVELKLFVVTKFVGATQDENALPQTIVT